MERELLLREEDDDLHLLLPLVICRSRHHVARVNTAGQGTDVAEVVDAVSAGCGAGGGAANQGEAFIEHRVFEIRRRQQRETSHRSRRDEHSEACRVQRNTMGEVLRADIKHRRGHRTRNHTETDQLQMSHRQELTHHGQRRDAIRRHSKVVLAKRKKRVASISSWNRADVRTMAQSEDGHRQNQRRVRGRRVLLAP